MRYCDSVLDPRRRLTREVVVGPVTIGGLHPVRVQSMLTCDTMDTHTCIQQTRELVDAGCEIVRITAPTVKDAANLQHIAKGLRETGCLVPLVADIHFKPEAALEAAKWVEKVRINPGNYADKKRFAVREYTDSEYSAELERISEKFTPLVRLCQDRGVAMRIGTNHGSLSDRIMNRYGDTPLGMVESALEFARIARDLKYHAFVFSMKSSNPKVMIAAYRLLVARLRELGPDWNYPIHLGVTEAGDGEDGRIKSAIGIGSLLADGIGDTVRVSLTEDSVHEIPVARALVEQAAVPFAAEAENIGREPALQNVESTWNPFEYRRRESRTVFAKGFALGGTELPRVALCENVVQALPEDTGDLRAELRAEDLHLHEVDPGQTDAVERLNALEDPVLVTVADSVSLSPLTAFRLLAARLDPRHPILLKDCFRGKEECAGGLPAMLQASTVLGGLLCEGIGDAIWVRTEPTPLAALRLSYNILQAAGSRIFKTDYVACPSCGRTLFNLQDTTARIKAATGHLKGVKIAIMGCIVNGPGEMADADFGYVGGAPRKINLYVGKNPVKFNIPEEEAVDRLKDLIAEHGKWIDP
jgi:(E)-4-hydroxy-3-methylbut-2-enyl-diphosphate synthase